VNPVPLIVRREVRERLRSRAFLVTNLVLLALVVAGVVLPALLGDDEPDALRLVTIEENGATIAAIVDQQGPAFDYDVTVSTVDDPEEARSLVADETADVALLDADTIAVREEPAGRLGNLLEGARRTALLDAALADAGVPPAERAALIAPSPVTVERVGDATTTDDVDEAVLFTGLAVTFVLYGLLIFYGQQVAQGLVQEKQSRVIEVLLAAVRPVHLLGGKLLGLGLLGLGQIVLLGGTAVIGLQVVGEADIPPGAVPTVVAGALWFLAGYALYATIFALAAAVVPKIEDLQTAMFIPIILLIGSLFVAQLGIADPDGALGTIGGMLPPVAPIYQPLTIALGTATPLRMGVAALGVLVTTAVLVPITARVHAGAALSLRSRVSVREALRRSTQ
jgi:ABC-2 type transport system permease protein